MNKIKIKQLGIVLFILTMLMQIAYTSKGQVASAYWPLKSSDRGITLDGNITAEGPVSIGYGAISYVPTCIIVNPIFGSLDPNRYLQFTIAPLTGHDLLVNEISSYIYTTSYNCYAQIRCSLSPDFADYEIIAPHFYVTGEKILFTYSNLNLTIPDGSKLYVRVYAYNGNTLGQFRMTDLTMSGHTEPVTCLAYEKDTFCTVDVSAEPILSCTEGGTFSASPQLPIDPVTGIIDLTSSLNDDYIISYSVSGEILATTNISVQQSPDCIITLTDEPVYPSTTYTFSAPGGMSGYEWSVTGNATITGNTNEQTVMVEADPSGDASFNVSLMVQQGELCTSTCSTDINADEPGTGVLPTATLSGTQSICIGNSADLTVSLTGQAPWTFNWTDGVDEYTVSETYDPQHAITVYPIKNTTYNLTGLVTDGNGKTNTCTGEARVYLGPITTAPDIIACPNTVINVPISVKLFNEVRDISLTLKYDPGVMTYQGFENGDIAFGEVGIGDIMVSDYAYEGYRVVAISKISDDNLPALADDAELLRLKFGFIGGNTEMEWIDSPDDSWCSYSYLSEQDETGFETEAFCDLPTAAHYVNGSVKQLSVSGTDMNPIAGISTITGTPVIIPVSVTYPDLTAQGISQEVLTDARISYEGTGSFPAGARIFKVTYNGNSVLSSPFYIGEKSEVLLSEILGTAANPLLGHSNQIVNWEFYVDGISSPVNIPVKIEALAYTSLNECVVVLDTESFNVTFADATLAVTESVTVCGTEPLQFTAEIGYPDISNLNTSIKTDAKINAASAFPQGTIITWNYNNSANGSYILPVSTEVIMLSTIVGTLPNPLHGHSGTDVWTFEISNAGLMAGNEVTIEAVVMLEGEYYIHSAEQLIFTVNPIPEVTTVSLLTSTDKSNWTTVNGNLSSGYNICADPITDFHYFDINALISSVELNSNLEKNAFYLDKNSVPTEFYKYWDDRGVNASATQGWQVVMWEIINGAEPMFYISYDGTDYKLVDGLQYSNDNIASSLRISGDYPAGSYTFSGTVTDVNGCVSEIINVNLNLSSAPVITCPQNKTANNVTGECGAAVTFAATATGSPAPVIVYTLSDGTEIESGYFFPVGTTTVTATAENSCKTVTCTFDITVIDTEAPAITCPVSDNIDVVMNNAGTYVHSGTSWDAYAYDNCLKEDLISYTLSGVTTGTGTSLDGVAFNMGTTIVTWNAMDNAENGNVCSFTVTVFGVNLNGAVKYYNKAETPMDDVTITLSDPATGAVVATTTTDISGGYSFASLSSGIYDVNIITDKSMRSINSTDAGQVNAWNVAQSGNVWPTIEKVRFLAGNVNEDDFVESGDAGMIQNYFLTLGTEIIFDKQWEFWKVNDPISTQPQSDNLLQVEIPAENSGIIQNFYGLVSGDFNRSNIPASGTANSLFVKSARLEEGSVTMLKGDTLLANTDDVIELPIRAVSSMQVGAISLILNYPPGQLQVVDVFLKDNYNRSAGFNVMDSILVIGWNSVNPISVKAGEPLVTVRLKLIGKEKGLPVYFELAANPLNELADENMIAIGNALLIMDGILMKEYVTGINAADRSELMLTCYPNPFNDHISFKYSLPENGRVNLDVTGILGNKIKILSDQKQPAGEYFIDLDGANLVPGVYHVALRLTDQNGQPLVTTVTLIKQ